MQCNFLFLFIYFFYSYVKISVDKINSNHIHRFNTNTMHKLALAIFPINLYVSNHNIAFDRPSHFHLYIDFNKKGNSTNTIIITATAPLHTYFRHIFSRSYFYYVFAQYFIILVFSVPTIEKVNQNFINNFHIHLN